jgi:hypothetical protein
LALPLPVGAVGKDVKGGGQRPDAALVGVGYLTGIDQAYPDMGIFLFKSVNQRPVAVEAAALDGQCDRYLFCLGDGRRGVYGLGAGRITAGGQKGQQQNDEN